MSLGPSKCLAIEWILVTGKIGEECELGAICVRAVELILGAGRSTCVRSSMRIVMINRERCSLVYWAGRGST